MKANINKIGDKIHHSCISATNLFRRKILTRTTPRSSLTPLRCEEHWHYQRASTRTRYRISWRQIHKMSGQVQVTRRRHLSPFIILLAGETISRNLWQLYKRFSFLLTFLTSFLQCFTSFLLFFLDFSISFLSDYYLKIDHLIFFLFNRLKFSWCFTLLLLFVFLILASLAAVQIHIFSF